ncbi:MAG: RNA methyltransferase [Parcubacteria group bacterium]|nr:RNA methyltransferase [Parcubacteria group bacterium]
MKNKKIVLVLHNIRSRYNVGSIFRTADCAGVNKIYLCGITPTPPHSRISKVALGAEDYVAWEKCQQTGRIIDKLKDKGYQIVALEQEEKSINYSKFKPKFPVALILGAEVTGLPVRLLNKCEKIIEIPMRGQKESLNVSVACGISIFQIINN